MHTRARRLHGPPHARRDSTVPETTGLVLPMDWRHDASEWLMDALLFRGQLKMMRRTALDFAAVQPGETALDVGCGSGTLALLAQSRVGAMGRVYGIDPGPGQIAIARAKALRRGLPATFDVGVIERLAFPDQTFDVVFSTLMMHHLPTPLKRAGLAEIARVLKPGGRLVIADFARKQDRRGRARRFHAGGSDIQSLTALLEEAGFTRIETRTLSPRAFSMFPGVSFALAQRPRQEV